MIKGDLNIPFVLFRTSGTSGPARYIAHSREADQQALDRGVRCLRSVYDGEVVVNAFWPAELNGAYYFTEAICRDLGVSYIGLGPGCLEELRHLSETISDICIATTGTNVSKYLNSGIRVKKILFAGDAPTTVALDLAKREGVSILPLAYSTTEHGPIAHFHRRCGDRFLYKFFDETEMEIVPTKPQNPLKGELQVRLRGGSFPDLMSTGDMIQMVPDKESRIFELLGRLSDSINFQGGLLKKSQFEHELSHFFGSIPKFQCLYSRSDQPWFQLNIDAHNFDRDALQEQLFSNYEIQFAISGAEFTVKSMDAKNFIHTRGKLLPFVETNQALNVPREPKLTSNPISSSSPITDEVRK